MANAGKLRWLFIGCVFVLISIYFLTSFLLFNFSNEFSTRRNLPKRSSDFEFSRRRMAIEKNGFPVLKVAQAGEHKNFRIKFNETLQRSGVDFWRSIIPRYECPSVLLEKIGGIKKGQGQQQVGKKKSILDWGKWTCGLKSLFGKESGGKSPCVMMSFGVDYDTRSDYTFEMEAVKKWNCSIHMFGHSKIKNLGPFISNSSDSSEHFNYTYKFDLDGSENRTTPDKNKLKNSILEVRNETGSVNVLKVVVKDGTYQQLDHLLKGRSSKRITPVMSTISQLFLEFHVRDWGNLSVQKNETGEPEKIVAVLKKLENMGFRLFKKNIIKNPEYKGCCREFSFVNLQNIFKS